MIMMEQDSSAVVVVITKRTTTTTKMNSKSSSTGRSRSTHLYRWIQKIPLQLVLLLLLLFVVKITNAFQLLYTPLQQQSRITTTTRAVQRPTGTTWNHHYQYQTTQQQPLLVSLLSLSSSITIPPKQPNFYYSGHCHTRNVGQRRRLTTTIALFSSTTATTSIVSNDDGNESNDSNSNSNMVGTGGTASISNEVFNLVKGIVGAGVLSLPYGIATYGNAVSAIYPAIVLIVVLGTLSGYSFGLIGRVCSITQTTSYKSAWEKSISKHTSWIPAVAVTLKTICATLAYSMILGDTFYALSVSAGITQLSKTTVLLCISSFILLPLCLLKNLSSLAPFSLLGSMGMVYTAIAMLIRYIDQSYKIPNGIFIKDILKSFQPSFGTIGASGVLSPVTTILLGMLSTAYMAHFNAPKFYIELKNNTISRFMKVVTASFGISIGLFTMISTLGFLTFGQNASGLILNNYSTKDILMSLSRIAVAISLVGSYPLAFVGARDGLIDLLGIQRNTTTNQTLNIITIGLLSSITFAALKIPDVSFVLAFAGATLGNALIYIFPGLMFRGAIQKCIKAPSQRQKIEVKVALSSAGLGFILGIMGAIQAVRSVL